jgi:hypothetical protein
MKMDIYFVRTITEFKEKDFFLLFTYSFHYIFKYYQLSYSYNVNPIKNTHLRHVTVHYFSRIVQPEAVFFPYWYNSNNTAPSIGTIAG